MIKLHCLCALLCAAVPALAQPIPKLTSLSRTVIQRGTTTEIIVAGENLANVTGFILSGDSGVKATNSPSAPPPKPTLTVESSGGGISTAEPKSPNDGKNLVAKFTVAADASLTAREVRVVSPAGVSNPLQLNVGHLPEVFENGSNNSLEQAQMVALPAVINGAISAAAQLDYFRFKATKGQEFIFDVDASRRGSPLDSSLALLDAKGKELARNEDARGLDSVIEYAIPEDGEYVIQLRDFRYQGGGNYSYRLTAGALPYVDKIFPLGGQRGKQVEVSVTGRNLESTTRLTLALSPNAPRGRQEIRAHTPNGLSNLFPFDVQDLSEIAETEPNNTTDKVNNVSVPVIINGRIDPAKDIDRFKFKSDKDQKLICEVLAQRIGSPLDALLVLTDAEGKIIQQNDDASGADARIEFDAKGGAEYTLSLRDLTDRGGENFSYRLSVRPPAAGSVGFAARFLPDTIRVHRGGLTKLRCEVTRNGGFDGPVRFAFQDLPSGVFSEPMVLTGTPASGLMVLTALGDAPLGNFPIKMSASATVGGKTVTQNAEAISGDKPAKESFLTVLDTAPFTLELVTLTASLEQNQSSTIEIMAQRRDGFLGDIKLSAEGFSEGREAITKSFEVGEATLKGSEALGKITLKAKVDSEIGTRTIVLRGESTADGQAVTQYSLPIPVTIIQYPFVLSSPLSKLSVTALPPGANSAANETETKIKVERRAGFAGDLTLTIEGLPEGIIATVDKIPANASETILKIKATEKAPVGKDITFTVAGAATVNDRNYKTKTGNITLSVAAPTELADTAAKPVAAGKAK